MLKLATDLIKFNLNKFRPTNRRLSDDSSPKSPASQFNPNCRKCGFYSTEVEDKINERIAMEFCASYTYLSMFCHFARSDVALSGCEKFFKRCASQEKQHAMRLCNYQTLRGGEIKLMTLEQPPKLCYTIADAFVTAVCIEKSLTEKLIEVKETAMRCDDDVTVDFIVTKFLKHQIKSIQQLNMLVTRLNMLKDNEVGVHLFDNELKICKL